MKKNVAGQTVGAQLINKTDGSPVTTGTTEVYITGDGGTQTLNGVSPSGAVHEGNGYWSYPPSQAETNYDHVAFTFVNSSAVNATIQIYTSFPQTGDNFARLGAPAGASVSADIAAAKVDTAAIKVKTDFLPSATAGSAGGVFIAGSNAATTANITGNLTGNVTGSVGSVAGGGIAAASFAAGAIDAAAIATDAIDADALKADAVTEIQSGLSTLTAAGVRTAVGLGSANLDTQLATLATASALSTVGGNVNTIRSTTDLLQLMIEVGAGSPTYYRFTAGAVELAGGSASAIADAVWDETLAGHAGVGSAGAALSAAGSAGDPWATPLPGAYGAGTAGKIVGDNVNATISSRATQVSVDTVDDFLDTEVAAIKAKTDNLPSDPADASDIAAAFAAADAKLDTIDNFLDTEIAAIKAKTDNLPAAPSAVSDVPTTAQIADKLLGRNLAGGSDGGRMVKDALRSLRNKTSISGGTLTVTEEDDTTPAWTATVTTAAGDPLTSIDPA